MQYNRASFKLKGFENSGRSVFSALQSVLKTVSLILIAAIFAQYGDPRSSFLTVASQRENDGIISLTVLDKDGKPLEGAKVSLFAADGKAIGAVKPTGAKGQLDLNVPSGQYRLQVEADKYESFNETGIEIAAMAVTRISLQLTEKLSISDEVVVRAESDNPIEKKDPPQAELRQEILKTAPLQSKDFDAALPIVPNVVRGPDGKVSIKGAREDQSALLINNADATDPATGNFALSIPLESIERVNVYTNPYLPEYGKFTGGVTKVETKRGGDKWKFELNDIFPEPRLRSGKLFGFTNFSPRIHFEGPIVKNRLFISQGLEYAIDKKPVRGLAAPDNEIIKDGFRSFSQFDLIVSPRQTLTFNFNLAPRVTRSVGLDFFTPKPAAPSHRVKDITAAVTNKLLLSGGSLIDALFQYKRIESRVFGQGLDPLILTPTVRGGNFHRTEDRETERYELRLSDTLPPIAASGFHNVKLGIDLAYLSNKTDIQNRRVTIRRADESAAQSIHFLNAPTQTAVNTQLSLFAQDQWLIRPSLSFDYGLRFEVQRATAGVSLMPRLAVAYSPRATGKTVFRAAFGLFYDKVPLNAIGFGGQPQQVVTSFAADGNTVIDGPRAFANLYADRRNGEPNMGRDFAAPRNTTFRFEVNRRIGKRVLFKTAYLDSRTRNDLFVAPIFDSNQSSITLFNSGRGVYRSLEITSDFELNPERSFSVSYIRSKARGELNDFNSYFGDFPDPVLRPNQFASLPTDAPNRLLARGSFKLPFQLTVFPLLDIHTGFPYSIRDDLQNFVGKRNSARFPRFVSLDVAVSKDIKLRDKYTAQFIVSIFNATDHFNPRNVRANLADPGFGQFFASYRRFYRLDFAFAW